MTVALSVLIPLMAWAPKAEKAKEVPGFFKLILPVLLIAVLLTVIGIAVLAIVDLLKKKVPLVDESAEYGELGSGEMTRYEADSRTRPLLGKVGAALFLIAVGAFFMMGLYTMGKGSSTTAQLRKEGREKSARIKKAGTETSLEVGEDDADKKQGAGEFGTGLDVKKKK